MKALNKVIAVATAAAAAAAPLASFAQTNQPSTRAHVRAELIELEKAGYSPATANEYNYPADIQAAEAQVAAKHAAEQKAAQTMGGVTGGSSVTSEPQSVYSGH